MPTEAEMKAVLQRYLDAWNAADPDGIVALFAADAVVHDPYGTPPHEGHAAVKEFFAGAGNGGVELTLDGPIRASEGDTAAMAFTVNVTGMKIAVVDVMRFDDTGKVVEMKAIWGPSDITTP